MNIGCLFGSFDPFHNSHSAYIDYLLNVHEMDKVLIIPSFAHPYKKNLLPFEHRINMCLFVAESYNDVHYAFFERKRCFASSVEERMGGNNSITGDVVEFIYNNDYPHDKLFVAVGADVLIDLPNWEGFDKLVSLASIIAMPRPEKAISSTIIREMIRNGENISHLVPRPVDDYIKNNTSVVYFYTTCGR